MDKKNEERRREGPNTNQTKPNQKKNKSINIQTIEQEMTYYIARSGKAMTALAPGRVVFLRMFSMFGLILKV